jgi:hypothetical protein
MTETLSEQLADYRAGWRARVPANRQASMDQHVAHLTASGIARGAKQVGERAPDIRLRDQHGEIFDVATLLAKGPVVVTFYRGGWCPFCNLVLLCHKFILRVMRWQQGQRGRVRAMARAIVTRTDVIELVTWRSGRIGGSAGSITVVNTRFFDEKGVAWS